MKKFLVCLAATFSSFTAMTVTQTAPVALANSCPLPWLTKEGTSYYNGGSARCYTGNTPYRVAVLCYKPGVYGYRTEHGGWQTSVAVSHKRCSLDGQAVSVKIVFGSA
jgi:hypothetical protein